MKHHRIVWKVAVMGLLVFAISFSTTINMPLASACGDGYGGGGGYTPQRRDEGGVFMERPALTMEQAGEIIEEHIARINPALRVGALTDTGPLFEADIVSNDGEVVQVMAVDKISGQLLVIN